MRKYSIVASGVVALASVLSCAGPDDLSLLDPDGIDWEERRRRLDVRVESLESELESTVTQDVFRGYVAAHCQGVVRASNFSFSACESAGADVLAMPASGTACVNLPSIPPDAAALPQGAALQSADLALHGADASRGGAHRRAAALRRGGLRWHDQGPAADRRDQCRSERRGPPTGYVHAGVVR